ncbi:MAG: SURF1 family protein [Hyphomicrobiaceae bacterium]|nr:SURF1 family protein [Hyphomicrobiaceae bacterium]
MKSPLTGWRRAGLVWPSVLAVAGVAVLIGLGNWQISRKAWKEGLIAQIGARTPAPPISLSEALQLWREGGDVEYLHVRVSGRFLHTRERHVFAIDERLGPGFHVYTPLETPEGQLVLVNRGFVPTALKDPSQRSAGQVDGQVTLSGLMRRPTPGGIFTPASDPARNLFYWPDYPAMLASVPEAGRGDLSAVPFFLEADAEPASSGGFPRGGVTRLTLPNRHLEYALTWYGLALTLVGVFCAFARARLRSAHGL